MSKRLYCFSQFGSENGLHELVEIVGYLVVDVEARLLSVFELHLVDVTVRVANHGWHQVIWQIGRLRQWDKLWTKLSHTLLHSLLHYPVRLRCKEAAIIDSLSVLKELLKCPNFANQFQDLCDAGVPEVSRGTLLPVDVELEILKVSASHGDLRLIEELVVLHFSASLGCHIVSQG